MQKPLINSRRGSQMTVAVLPLIGAFLPWNTTSFAPSDDSVRGGASFSNLTISPTDPTLALFSGVLNTTALGGAGFASQRTVGALRWNLSPYDGLLVTVVAPVTDGGKTYTITLKDTLPCCADDGNSSSLLYEADFDTTGLTPENNVDGRTQTLQSIKLPFESFVAEFRGRPVRVNGSKPLNREGIQRLSVMMRSFFGKQEGPFSLTLSGIAAYKNEGV